VVRRLDGTRDEQLLQRNAARLRVDFVRSALGDSQLVVNQVSTIADCTHLADRADVSTFDNIRAREATSSVETVREPDSATQNRRYCVIIFRGSINTELGSSQATRVNCEDTCK